MNRYTLAIAAGLAVLSGTALAQDVDRRGRPNLDLDGDGVVSFEEFAALGTDLLARMDSDGNGVITLDEFINNPPGPRMGNRGPRGDRPDGPDDNDPRAEMREMRIQHATEEFQEIDRDGDELLTPDELLEAIFLRMDADGNGVLSETEMRPPHRGPGRRSGGSQRGQPGQH